MKDEFDTIQIKAAETYLKMRASQTVTIIYKPKETYNYIFRKEGINDVLPSGNRVKQQNL